MRDRYRSALLKTPTYNWRDIRAFKGKCFKDTEIYFNMHLI